MASDMASSSNVLDARGGVDLELALSLPQEILNGGKIAPVNAHALGKLGSATSQKRQNQLQTSNGTLQTPRNADAYSGHMHVSRGQKSQTNAYLGLLSTLAEAVTIEGQYLLLEAR